MRDASAIVRSKGDFLGAEKMPFEPKISFYAAFILSVRIRAQPYHTVLNLKIYDLMPSVNYQGKRVSEVFTQK